MNYSIFQHNCFISSSRNSLTWKKYKKTTLNVNFYNLFRHCKAQYNRVNIVQIFPLFCVFTFQVLFSLLRTKISVVSLSQWICQQVSTLLKYWPDTMAHSQEKHSHQSVSEHFLKYLNPQGSFTKYLSLFDNIWHP